MTLRSFVNVLVVLAFAQGAVLGAPDVSELAFSDVVGEAVRAETGALPVADQRGPKKVNEQSLGVVTSAPSVLIRDVETGMELMARQDREVRPIASITKLMTALVLLDDYEWGWYDDATVLRSDVTEGGRWYYRFGDELTMDDLFTTMLVASGNNETLALVREVGVSQEEFVSKMNAKAQEMDLRDTRFADPIGLSAGNVSTAADVRVLLYEALSREPISSRVRADHVETESKLGNSYNIESTNELFDSFLNRAPYDVIGGKTGSTDEAGYCLATRVERSGHLVDVVVLGATHPDARFDDVEDLVSWAFDVYAWK